MLGIVQPAGAQLGVDRLSLGDHGLEIVGDQDLEAAAEELPGSLAASDHRDQVWE